MLDRHSSLTQLTDEEYLCGHFQQDSITAHMPSISLYCSRVMNIDLWHLSSPDNVQYDFSSLGGCLNSQTTHVTK
jgi:hypothetical protein